MRDRHAIPFAERTISLASAAVAAIAVAVFAVLAAGCEPRLFIYEKEYVVSLELDLNAQERVEITFEKITDYTFPDCPWKKAGLAFDGWKVVLNSSSDDSTLYKPGERVTVSRNMRFTAEWTGMYRVMYLSNGVSSPDMPVDNTKYCAGQSTVVPEYSWKNEIGDDGGAGYYFGGWNTVADGTGTVYLPGMKLAVWADVTLYAQWKPLYRVWYAQETGEAAERLIGGTYLPNEQIVVNGVAPFSSSGNVAFLGWSLNPLGTGTCYQQGDKFEFTITEIERDVGVAFYDVTFYPVWEKPNSSL